MAQRGRPSKMRQLELPTLENPNVEQGENVMETVKLPVRHVMRGINKNNTYGSNGDVPADVVEQRLSEYYADGYVLKEVYMLLNDPNFVNFMYILILRE